MSRFAILRSILFRLRFTDAATTYVEHKIASSPASNISFTWPVTLPVSTQNLTVDAAGNFGYASSGGGGSVTSVGLSAPSLFAVSGSPVTVSGTLALAFASQSANTFLAAPNGSAGLPTMRGLVIADISSLIGTGAGTIAAGNDSRFHTQGTDLGTTQTSFQINSGASGARLKDATGVIQIRNAADSANADLAAANLTLSGNLTVQGTTTTIDSNTLAVGDSIITLNNDVTTGSPTENAGIEVRRGASPTVQIIQWQEAALDTFVAVGTTLRRVGVSLEQTFVNADLTAGIYTWTHNLGRQYFPVSVIDNTNKSIGCEITYSSTTQATIDLTGFGTLTGTWRIVAG